MSRIDELIAEFCPDGVPYHNLGEVAAYSTTRVPASAVDGETFVGVDNLRPNPGGRTSSNYVPKSGYLTEYRAGDVLIGNIRPYLKKIWLATNSGGCSGDVLAVRIRDSYSTTLEPEFLYRILSSEAFFAYDMQHAKGAKMPRGSKPMILKYRVPVPPLEVQREIVRVLDLFTTLEAELEAELEARRRQYAHYRDSLLTFPEGGVRWVPMGEVASIVRGASPRPIQAFLTTADEGIPWIKIGDVPAAGKYITGTAERVTVDGAGKSRRVYPGDFVLSNSMSFGRPYISQIEGCIHDGWLAISDFGDSFVPDFLYHLLRSAPVQAEFARRAGGGTVQNLNADIVKAVVVPIPPLAEQARIATILDKFDALVNDLSVGLPAELAARRKQYEYYRDRLLTFKEAAA
ncbi:MAG: restriction endonuclease subunit S [Actinomycetota bacterium]